MSERGVPDRRIDFRSKRDHNRDNITPLSGIETSLSHLQSMCSQGNMWKINSNSSNHRK